MLRKSTLIIIVMTLLTLVIVGLELYTIFQHQTQNDQQHDQMDQESIDVWSYTFHHDAVRTGYTTSTGPLTNQTLDPLNPNANRGLVTCSR
jgi:flagellar basal body-associated protein FliL